MNEKNERREPAGDPSANSADPAPKAEGKSLRDKIAALAARTVKTETPDKKQAAKGRAQAASPAPDSQRPLIIHGQPAQPTKTNHAIAKVMRKAASIADLMTGDDLEEDLRVVREAKNACHRMFDLEQKRVV